MSLNRVEIQGSLTREPKTEVMPSGVLLVECTLAVSDARFNAETGAQEAVTMYVSVQFWDVLAKRITEAAITTGDELWVIGRLDQKEIEKRDGTKDRKTRVHALAFTATRYSKRHVTAGGDPWS
jgi:single-stranded DNA-binding protein